jgi:hypothetical protein
LTCKGKLINDININKKKLSLFKDGYIMKVLKKYKIRMVRCINLEANKFRVVMKLRILKEYRSIEKYISAENYH